MHLWSDRGQNLQRRLVVSVYGQSPKTNSSDHVGLLSLDYICYFSRPGSRQFRVFTHSIIPWMFQTLRDGNFPLTSTYGRDDEEGGHLDPCGKLSEDNAI